MPENLPHLTGGKGGGGSSRHSADSSLPPLTGSGSSSFDLPPLTSGGSRVSHGGQVGKKAPHGFSGFVHNVAHGVEANTLGIIPAMKDFDVAVAHTVAQLARHPTHPIRALEHHNELASKIVYPLAKSYAYKYGSGDLSTTLHRALYEDPVGTFMDAAAGATLGGAGAARLGARLGAAGLISDTSRFATLGTPGEIRLRSPLAREGTGQGDVFTRATHRNPVIRARQTGIHRLVNLLPEELGGHQLPTAELARYARATERQRLHESRRVQVMARDFHNAKLRLSKAEKTAYDSLANAQHPNEQIAHLKASNEDWQTNKIVQGSISQLEKAAKAFEEPSKNLQKTLDLGHKLGVEQVNERFKQLSRTDLRDYRGLQRQADIVEQRLSDPEHELTRVEHKALTDWGKINERLGLSDAHPASVTDQHILQASEAHWRSELQPVFDQRPYLHLRLARDAKYVDVPGEGENLAEHRGDVNALQGSYDRQAIRAAVSQRALIEKEAKRWMPGAAKAAPEMFRPRTYEEAQARFEALDKQYQDFVSAVAKQYGHPEFGTKFPKQETQYRSNRRAEFKKQQSGKTSAGAASGASGWKTPKLIPTLTEETRAHAEALIQKMITDSNHPTFQRVGGLIAERDRLAEQIGRHQEQALGAAPGEKPVDFGKVKVPRKVRKPVKPRKGEPSTPADFASVPMGAKVLTYDWRLLTPDHASELERRGTLLSEAKNQLESAEKRWLTKHGHLPADVTPAQKDRLYDAARQHLPAEGAKDTTVLQGGPTIDELKAELQAKGQPQPIYQPDMVPRKAAKGMAAQQRGGGLGVPKGDGGLKRNLGTLFSNGALFRSPEALTVKHLALTRAVQAEMTHEQLLRDGVPLPQGESLRPGWTFVRSGLSEKISHMERTSGQTLQELIGPDAGKLDFTTKDSGEALLDGERHIMVPEAYAKALTGEFTKSNAAIRYLWTKPTNVWRAIVLGLRPGFFTNNAVGNYLMLGLRHHDWASVQAWMSMLRETRSTKALDELGRDKTFHRLAMQHIPETYLGTFGHSAFEGLASKRLGRLSRGVAPITMKYAEEVPRTLIARKTAILRMRELGHEIPKQTQDFNALSEKMLSDPEVQRRAIDEANNTLGDYLHYNEFEKQIRQLVPFYGWLRAITKVAMHASLNTPGRMLLISNLSRVALQEQQQAYGNLPDYMQGFLPISGEHGGHVWGIGTAGLNPYATLAQLARATEALLTGHPGQGAGALSEIGINPFLQSLYEYTSGKALYSGASIKKAPYGLGGGLAGFMLGDTLQGLPPSQLLAGLLGAKSKSRVYINQNTPGKALAQFAGVPIHEYDIPSANRTANLPPRR